MKILYRIGVCSRPCRVNRAQAYSCAVSYFRRRSSRIFAQEEHNVHELGVLHSATRQPSPWRFLNSRAPTGEYMYGGFVRHDGHVRDEGPLSAWTGPLPTGPLKPSVCFEHIVGSVFYSAAIDQTDVKHPEYYNGCHPRHKRMARGWLSCLRTVGASVNLGAPRTLCSWC